MTEQRYKAVLAVIAEGRTVTQVARDWDVARQTVHVWLERYEADGLEGLANHSATSRARHCSGISPGSPPLRDAELLLADPVKRMGRRVTSEGDSGGLREAQRVTAGR